MTACDLSASAKPWDIQVKTVKVIFEEFYEQGDAEKLAGQVPSPLMDRDRKCELGEIQVGFLTGICLPCYSLLYRLIPETKPMLDQCQANLQRWREIDEEIKKQKQERGGVDALSFLDKVLETSEEQLAPSDCMPQNGCKTKQDVPVPATDRREITASMPAEEQRLSDNKPVPEVDADKKDVSETAQQTDFQASNLSEEDIDVSIIIEQLTDEELELEMQNNAHTGHSTLVKHGEDSFLALDT